MCTARSDAHFKAEVARYGAVQVRRSGSRDESDLPLARDVPERAIWFETTNFGWILSARSIGGRRVLLQF